MNTSNDGLALDQDWHTDLSAIPSSSLINNGATNDSIDIDWLLSHLPSQSEVKTNEQGWEDVAAATTHSMQRVSSQSSSLWDGSTRSVSGSKSRGVKRRRPNDAHSHAHTTPNTSLPYQARQNALHQISMSGWKEGCLTEMETFVCEDKHCFSMEPMGQDPRGYSGEPIRRESFQVRIIEPPNPSQRLNIVYYPAQNFPVSRQMGRSLHLIIAKYPRMIQPESLESGFALLIVCHRDETSEQWSPFCLVAFTGSTQSKKTSSDTAHFVANLDRCTKAENGKRIWGERTSHVKHEKSPAKPIRIEPRGPGQTFASGQEYCIVVTLHDTQGKLLIDAENAPCIAQSNPFFFKSQNVELTSQSRRLLEEFEKLSVSQRTLLVTSSSSADARQLLLSNSPDTQKAAGVFISTRDNKLTASACALSEFHKDPSAPLSPAYLARMEAVASYLGHRHANVDLTDHNIRSLRTVNSEGAEGRYTKLFYGGAIVQHQDWLYDNGVTMKLIDVYNRVQMLQSIMHTREYRSNYIICVGNVYPEEIMVDRLDATKVYCLFERADQDTLELADRLYPLARFAFCSKIPRSLIKQTLLLPYRKAFQDAGGNGTQEEALQEEKFWLILQGIFLDYFLYWTELHNAESCQKIQQRLLEDDIMMDNKFFDTGKMNQFPIG